jgi:hypothetical protein
MYRFGNNKLGFAAGGQVVVTLDESQKMGIGTSNPNSYLETAGSFATAIDVTTADLTLTDTHHTIILGGSHAITLPVANTCKGRMYVIKNPSILPRGISTYKNLQGQNVTVIPGQVAIWIQSDGTNWQQLQ